MAKKTYNVEASITYTEEVTEYDDYDVEADSEEEAESLATDYFADKYGASRLDVDIEEINVIDDDEDEDED